MQTSPIVSSYNSAGKHIYATYPNTLHLKSNSYQITLAITDDSSNSSNINVANTNHVSRIPSTNQTRETTQDMICNGKLTTLANPSRS
jgi:hypothetical protein